MRVVECNDGTTFHEVRCPGVGQPPVDTVALPGEKWSPLRDVCSGCRTSQRLRKDGTIGGHGPSRLIEVVV